MLIKMDSVSIPMTVLNNLLSQLNKAIDICANAEYTDFRDPRQDPMLTYPGATGWSRSAMTHAVSILRECQDASKAAASKELQEV